MNTLNQENAFRDVPTFEGLYAISPEGVVKSLDRYIELPRGTTRRIKERILKLRLVRDGGEDGTTTAVASLSKDSQRHCLAVGTLLKITYPELFPPISDLEGEVWKPMLGYERLMVSNLGRLKRRAFNRSLLGIEFIEPEKLIPFSIVANTGHRTWGLSGPSVGDKEPCVVSAGRTVWEAFNGEIKTKERVAYKDDDCTNVCIENLYLTLDRF